MMKIIIELKNNYKTKKSLKLLNGFCNLSEPNLGIPKKVSIKVWVRKGGDFREIEQKIEYKDLLSQTSIEAIAVSIISTTNNRRLDFYTINAYGEFKPIIPQISKNGKRRPTNDEWNEKTWNIADTKEYFFIDGKEIIFTHLAPKQKYRIELKVEDRISVSEYFSMTKAR